MHFTQKVFAARTHRNRLLGQRERLFRADRGACFCAVFGLLKAVVEAREQSLPGKPGSFRSAFAGVLNCLLCDVFAGMR